MEGEGARADGVVRGYHGEVCEAQTLCSGLYMRLVVWGSGEELFELFVDVIWTVGCPRQHPSRQRRCPMLRGGCCFSPPRGLPRPTVGPHRGRVSVGKIRTVDQIVRCDSVGRGVDWSEG